MSDILSDEEFERDTSRRVRDGCELTDKSHTRTRSTADRIIASHRALRVDLDSAIYRYETAERKLYALREELDLAMAYGSQTRERNAKLERLRKRFTNGRCGRIATASCSPRLTK